MQIKPENVITKIIYISNELGYVISYWVEKREANGLGRMLGVIIISSQYRLILIKYEFDNSN